MCACVRDFACQNGVMSFSSSTLHNPNPNHNASLPTHLLPIAVLPQRPSGRRLFTLHWVHCRLHSGVQLRGACYAAAPPRLSSCCFHLPPFYECLSFMACTFQRFVLLVARTVWSTKNGARVIAMKDGRVLPAMQTFARFVHSLLCRFFSSVCPPVCLPLHLFIMFWLSYQPPYASALWLCHLPRCRVCIRWKASVC